MAQSDDNTPSVDLEKWPDLEGWCGHMLVSTRSWTCPDCGCVLPDAAKARLLAAPTQAPPNHVWVLDWVARDDTPGDEAPSIFGVFSDRSRIARLILRGLIASAKDIRARNIHWYQCVHNRTVFEGWEETEVRDPYVWSLTLHEIDDVG